MSIIMPAHNAADHLEAALASVYAQTSEEWEVVAVDDGSTDATWALLQAAGPRVRGFRNEVATGPAAARNRALREARGELVAFLDADDLLEPDYLASQLGCLERARSEGRRVGLVTCDARVLDADGFADHLYRDMLPSRDEPLTLASVLARNGIYISSLVPVPVGVEVGWFDEELFGTEDFGLWVKILELGYEAILNPRPLAVYRRGSGSVSANVARQAVNNRRVYTLALARGRLDVAQQEIARRAIRYSVAMEAMARLRFEPRRGRAALRLARLAPLLLRVALTHRELWAQWIAVLRAGRQVPAARRDRP